MAFTTYLFWNRSWVENWIDLLPELLSTNPRALIKIVMSLFLFHFLDQIHTECWILNVYSYSNHEKIRIHFEVFGICTVHSTYPCFFWKNETFHLIFDHSFRTSCLWYWFYVIILSECDIAFLCCSLISSLSSSASATLPILLCWRQMSKSFRMPLTQNTFDEKEKKAKDLKITKKAGHQILCSPKLSKHSLFLWDSVIKKFVKTRCNFELLEDGTVSFQSKSFKSFVQFFFFLND